VTTAVDVGRFAKPQTRLVVAGESGALYPIVSVPMTDRDAIVRVVTELPAFYKAIGDTPAEEDALAIPVSDTLAEDGPLRSRARVESEIRVVQCLTRLKADIITDLKAEAIAVTTA
jgi:hypothetical protein